MTRLVLAFLMSILPAVSFSAQTWTALGTVTAVYSHNGQHVIETNIVDAPCGTAGKFWWPTSDSDAKDMFALALSAYVAGKRIRVVHDPAATSCSSGGNLATFMGIQG